MRAGVSVTEAPLVRRSEKELREHTKKLFDWVHQDSSRIRMLYVWQTAGGLSHIASRRRRQLACGALMWLQDGEDPVYGGGGELLHRGLTCMTGAAFCFRDAVGRWGQRVYEYIV